ncbi:probable maltase [Periplaneta americana]|uniref:probable maltase n=1 Tax=Periplaneta americana TaxID=6978 RepID=UPI0037E9A406
MEGDKENSKDMADGNIQLVEKQSGDHLPENSTMLKENGEPDDGAEEKLVAEDGALKTNKDASEVKFISVDSQNGDAKIDIENMKLAFAGMGKEELMKFANDPFWVRLRWFLFIFFWLLWAAMLAGAIAIIVMAPKCAAPAPLKWWEQSPLYQVFVPAFKDGGEKQDGRGDLKGLQSKLDYIGGLGIKGVAISPILKLSEGGPDEAVEDFKDVDPKFGTLAEFDALLSAMKDKGLHLVMSFIPNHTSKKHPWFVSSEKNEVEYRDYYVWSSGSGSFDPDGKRKPPNNWKSVTGDSAWTWSDVRKAFYLHQFSVDEPDLNFTNPSVIEEFKDIFKFWLDRGVSGLQLEKVEYLLEDPKKQDESINRQPGPIHDEYEFYLHTKTLNYPGIVDVLLEWKSIFQNYTDGSKMFSIAGNLSIDSIVDKTSNSSRVAVDMLQTSILFSHLKNGFTASELNRTVFKYFEKLPGGVRPTWQLSSSVSSRVPSRLSADYVDGLNMVAMLLPGTPITLYGEEIGMEDASSKVKNPARCVMSWSNATNAGFSESESPAYPTSSNYEYANVEAESETSGSSLSVYKELVTARNSPSIMYGDREYAEISNGTVFAITRIKSGNPGYVVAFNTEDEEVTVSLNKLKHIPEELTVLIVSSNFNITGVKAKSKLNRDSVRLSARGALVATFVPHLE